MDRDGIINIIDDICYQCERDGAIEMGLWVLNHFKLSEEYDRQLRKKLSDDYDFYIDD